MLAALLLGQGGATPGLAQALPGDPMTMPSPLMKQFAPQSGSDAMPMTNSGRLGQGGGTGAKPGAKAGIGAFRDLSDKLQRMGYGKAEASKLASYCVGRDLTLLSSCVEAAKNGLDGKL